jgi:hypothetical protein
VGWALAVAMLEIPDDLPPTTRRAIVFIRRMGATGLGHIAWAFEWYNGWFNAGSVENATNKPYAMPEEMSQTAERQQMQGVY